MYKLRPYQEEATQAALEFFRGNSKYNALEVLPTGSGKSLIIANIARELGHPALIFQPRKEILEQNLAIIDIEAFKIADGGNGKCFISNGRRKLTNVYYGN